MRQERGWEKPGAPAIIVSSLLQSPSRALQNCEAAIEAWEKLSSRCANKFMINRLILLNNLPNMKPKSDVQMGYYVAQLESQFSKLAAKIPQFRNK